MSENIRCILKIRDDNSPLELIQQDRDREFTFGGMLRELPMLPSQRAILLGWASELPVMVQMNYLDEEQRPQSNDPDYWDIWTAHGDNFRKSDWGAIARDWQLTR